MSFDFKKLDYYKVAIDDGFVYTELEHDGNEGTGTAEIDISKGTNQEYRLYETYNEEVVFTIIETDWETFKKKVADYFLNNN